MDPIETHEKKSKQKRKSGNKKKDISYPSKYRRDLLESSSKELNTSRQGTKVDFYSQRAEDNLNQGWKIRAGTIFTLN